jgi:hypothetical protein
MVEEAVDKMCLPAVVRLSRSFWDDARNDTTAEKRQFVVRQLTVVTAPVPPRSHTRAAALWYSRKRFRKSCRSAGAVPSAGSS